MIKIPPIHIYTLVAICLLHACQLKADSYQFVSIENLVEQEIGRLVLPQIYQNIGIDISVVPMPGKRAQHLVASGKYDGEIMRIYDYGLQNTAVARVPTPYFQLETMAFVLKDSGVQIHRKQDLSRFSVAKISGVKHTDLITNDLKNVSVFNNTHQMMRVLSRGRTDVALTNTIDGLIAIRDLNITNVKTSELPIRIYPLYHYVHKDKAQLVETINNEIIRLKKTGELKQLITEAQSTVIDFWGEAQQ